MLNKSMDIHQAIMDELSIIKRIIAESDRLRCEAMEMSIRHVNEEIKAADKDPLVYVNELLMKRRILNLELEVMDLKKNLNGVEENGG
ncbi:hypothetical protein [Bacillus infantis]|uniref:Uncharacterized protein n=1 Tax=Bacillus infantis TaxID=324767 RepID=A0A5D4R9R2_9BACI|nr:hypothetical protein [Bacillus infantis]TYS46754.1 hypothetical protein FZD51_14880 [Bacillus infantis]